MPSFQDSAVIFVLALLLFGPKKLPVLARELGKWLAEFRRASNEFKMQMEEELRLSEQADKQKKIEAMEAAAPTAPLLEGVPVDEPEHPHLPAYSAEAEMGAVAEEPPEPLPIATSGDLDIMPPATGLPTPRGASHAPDNSLGSLLESIPHTPAETESAAHG